MDNNAKNLNSLDNSLGIVSSSIQKNYLPFYEKDNFEVNLMNGILLEMNNTKYVLTNYHGIKNMLMIKFNIKNTEYKMKLHQYSIDLDLALLKFSNKSLAFNDNIYFCTLNDILYSVVNGYHIKYLNVNYYQRGNIEPTNIDCKIGDIKHISNNLLYPINIESIELIVDNNIDYHGLSGSLLVNNNKIIGMISNYNNGKIYAISSLFIIRFLSEIHKTGIYCGLCSLMSNFNPCSYFSDEFNEKKYGLLVINSNDINFNSFMDIKKSKCLKNGDILISFDDHDILEKGNIFDKKRNQLINFNTYILANYIKYDNINLSVMRKCGEEYKKRNIKIYFEPYETFKYIPLKANYEVIDYNGFQFMELSEEIFDQLINLGIDPYPSVKEYIKKQFRNKHHYIVILVGVHDVEYTKNSSKKIQLPFILQENAMYNGDKLLSYVFKLNKKKILSLNDMKKELYLNRTNNIRMKASDDLMYNICVDTNINKATLVIS